MRERLGYYMFRNFGIAAPRSNHVLIYINGEFNGVFANTEQIDGPFTYKGDRGKHTLQISESMNVATSIDGGTAFETVDTGAGRKSVFDIITNVVNTIGNADALSGQGSARAMAALDFKVPRDPQNWSFTLQGGIGSSNVNLSLINI